MISIVVPICNSEKYLNRCIDSLLNQTFKDIEILLIDDGSKDNSINVCREYVKNHSNIKLIESKHIGQGAIRNIGISSCESEYILFMDSDDYVDPMYCEILYKSAIDNNSDLCICDYCFTKEYILKNRKPINIIKYSKDDAYNLFFRANKQKGYYAPFGKLIKKELIKDIRFIEDKINEDILFFYELIEKANNITYIDNELYYYFYNPSSITNRTFNKEKLDLFEIWDIVLQKVKNNNSSYIKLCTQNIMRARFTLLAKMHIDGYDKNDKELVKIHNDLKKYVRNNYFELLKVNMPLNRKILMTFLLF